MTPRAGNVGPASERPVVLAGLAVSAIAFALYLPALRNGFVNWDDVEYLTSNPHLGRFDWRFVQWSFTTWWYANWHPLTWITYGVDRAIWGMNPLGFHLTNVAFHAANSFVVVQLAARLFRRAGVAADAGLCGAVVVGALFACHPLHVESVAWVSERKDVLYAFFTLLGVLRYLDFTAADSTRRERRRAYAWALAFFVLAVMSKPMALTFPLVLLILDAWPLARLADRTQWLRIVVVEKLPFYAVALASAVVTLLAQRAGGTLEMADLSLVERLIVAGRALGFYLAKLIAPVTLVPLYPLPPEISPLAWETLLALVAVAAITGLAWAMRHRAPLIAAAWAYYVVTLLPVLGLVKAGEQAAADRYTYLPMLGPLFVLGALAAVSWQASAEQPFRRRTGAALVAVVVLLLGARTVAQVAVWRDSFTLWEHVIRHEPDSVTAHYNLGYSHYLVENLDAAQVAYERALAIDPHYTAALNELGGIHFARGAYERAVPYLEAAVAAEPTTAHYHLNLAIAYEELGRFEPARQHYFAFIELAPPAQAARAAEIRKRLTGY
jgi:tetratricopeptide (TPR) repeat protein